MEDAERRYANFELEKCDKIFAAYDPQDMRNGRELIRLSIQSLSLVLSRRELSYSIGNSLGIDGLNGH